MGGSRHSREGGNPVPTVGLDSRLRGNDGIFTESAIQLAGLTTALFHWPPDTFWQTTPAELATILAAFADQADTANPATSDTLTTLMEQFPDG